MKKCEIIITKFIPNHLRLHWIEVALKGVQHRRAPDDYADKFVRSDLNNRGLSNPRNSEPQRTHSPPTKK